MKNVYRQKKSILFKVIQYLRNKPLYKFKNVEDESGNIIVCNNIMNMLKQYSYLFKLSGDFNDKNLVKLVTYTNNRITALNKIIRNFILYLQFPYSLHNRIFRPYTLAYCPFQAILIHIPDISLL